MNECDLFARATNRTLTGPHIPLELLIARAATLMMELFVVEGRKAGLNYGIERVEVNSDVPFGSRIRTQLNLTSTTVRADGALDADWELTIEVQGIGAACRFIAKTRYLF